MAGIYDKFNNFKKETLYNEELCETLSRMVRVRDYDNRNNDRNMDRDRHNHFMKTEIEGNKI